MDPAFDPIIAIYTDKVRALEKQLTEAKRMANKLCEDDGRPPIYASVESAESPGLATINRDTFYGQPLATAVTAILKMRKASNLGPASIDEIHEALKRGGYQFGAKDDDYAKRGLRNSINKNTQAFHRLPTDAYGLREWYPNLPKPAPRPKPAAGAPKLEQMEFDEDGVIDDSDDDDDDDDDGGVDEVDEVDAAADAPVDVGNRVVTIPLDGRRPIVRTKPVPRRKPA